MTARGTTCAFVTGVGGPAGRATAAFLREQGVAVVVADARRLDEEPGLVPLPLATDPAFVPALLGELKARRAELLVPTVTEELPLVARERGDLRASGCAVFISSPEAAEAANDKWLTVQALARAGVGVPRSLSGRARDEIVDAVGFPMLSKPRHGRGGRGVEIHESLADLPSTSCDRIYQEFLPGEEYDVNLFAEPGGEPAALVVLRKTALRDGRVGNAAGVERVEAPDVADLAAATSRALRLEGPLDIDVRRDRDGRPLVLEVNGRVGANVRSADEVLETLLKRWRELP
jgi:carbamoyl-phosphate synthase large subunit